STERGDPHAAAHLWPFSGGRRTRAGALSLLALSLTFAAGPESGLPDPGEGARRDRIAALVRQLGDKEFAKREAASKELDGIGEPALDALRKGAAADDAE